jgi:uncharacterized protein involved in tellurium resistance
MEHALHLGAHHFIKALGRKGGDNESSKELGLDLEDGDDRSADDLNGEFNPEDVLEKVLALIGLVSAFL